MRVHGHDDLFSKLTLGSGAGAMRSPGVVTLSGHDRNPKWEKKSAKGQQGATTTLNGSDPGEFTATFYLAGDTDDADGNRDFDEWEAFQKLIESTTNGPKPVALPIYHPDLARNGFTEVVNGGIGGRVHDGKGGASHTVKFLEYRPAKPKPAAKASPKPGSASGPTARPDPNAAAKAELAALLDEARKP